MRKQKRIMHNWKTRSSCARASLQVHAPTRLNRIQSYRCVCGVCACGVSIRCSTLHFMSTLIRNTFKQSSNSIRVKSVQQTTTQRYNGFSILSRSYSFLSNSLFFPCCHFISLVVSGFASHNKGTYVRQHTFMK